MIDRQLGHPLQLMDSFDSDGSYSYIICIIIYKLYVYTGWARESENL